MKKISLLTLLILLVLTPLGQWRPVQASPSMDQNTGASWRLAPAEINKIDPALQSAINDLQSSAMVTVIVTLKDQANLKFPLLQTQADTQKRVIDTLQTQARTSQRAILSVLGTRQRQGLAAQVVPFWIFNGLSITGTPDLIAELAKRDDVLSITPDAIDIIPVGSTALAAPENNLSIVNAKAMWDLGYTGQGIVVANLDSGVDIGHPDLASRWRGGSNSWYDPYGQHPSTPTDLSGHGTWTMGIMVGGDAGGTTLGMAPGARWIAARIFNDSGSSSSTAIHRAYQWVINPDGNPATADAPQVVNNSWAFGYPGCNLSFQNDLRALRAAGILPVFAAGNYGPGTYTSASPANYPEALAVGAVDNNGGLYMNSSRGPSACGETSHIFPELVAPGVNINTTDLFGLYTHATGTSLSAPHVAGGLALLLGAFPGLSVDTQAASLMNSAVDLGPAGPDNQFGSGRLDVLAAYNWLLAGNQATPTPILLPTATPSRTPTATLSPSNTATQPPLPTATRTPTPTALATAPQTPTPTVTQTQTPSSTATSTPTPTQTLLPTATQTPTPTTTATQASLPTATNTLSPTATVPPMPTATSTPSPTATQPVSPTATSASGMQFADSFESGDFSAWSNASTNGGSLSVSAQAAQVGQYGMQATINNSTAMFVQDSTPASEMTYHARFYFNPGTTSLIKGKIHDILVGLDAGGNTIFHIQYGKTNAGLLLSYLISGNQGEVSSNLVIIAEGSNVIEISWSAASSTTASDGSGELYVNNVLVAAVSGLRNGSYRLEDVHLGPQNLPRNLTGTEYFDDFASTRNTYIGP